MIYAEALQIAERVKAQLEPFCHRIEIGGSIRRKKPEVKDVEIICEAKHYETGLFASGIATIVDEWEKVKGDLDYDTCKYTQRILPEGIKLDLFFTRPENWGYIFALRTGSAEYNFKILQAIKDSGHIAEGGRILHPVTGLCVVDTEIDFFNLINLPFIKPEERI